MYILGLTTMGDGSAALIRDGEIVAAAEEERFSRIKHHVGFPFQALEYCLREAGITINDVEHIGLYWKPWILGRRLIQTLSSLPYSYRHFLYRAQRGVDQVGSYYLDMFRMKKMIQRRFGGGNFQFHYVEHHMSHAASCFYVSPFDNAAIFTIDGTGESTTVFFAQGRDKRIDVLKRIKLPHSLGQFYSAITNFLGFDMMEGDEYKVMGMAGYGEPEFYDFFRKNVVRLNGKGDFSLDIGWLDHHLARHRMYSERIKRHLGPPRNPEEEVTQRHYNIAASAQKILEDTVMHLLRFLYEETGERNLCMAGGVALNSVMNGRILREGPFDKIFIQPAAMDAGCSLGAAYYIYHSILNKPRHYVMSHAYLGPAFSRKECRNAIENRGLRYEILNDEDIALTTAKILSEGKLVAWFQGRMEWGPRALGSRSILADPRDPRIKDVVNEKIKLREPFRPFAPSMAKEASAQYFGKSYDAPFMLLVFPVLPKKKGEIPAVVHVDGTARPQTVERKSNPLYYSLIKEFEKLTGVPVVLNTSFNIQEPIVCTPQDAVSTFLASRMDYLMMENFLVRKE